MSTRIRQSSTHAGPGLTLVEMVVVIGICGVLAMLLIPFVLKARSHARTIVCSDNLKSLGQAYAVCLFNSNGALPDVYYTYENLGGSYQINLRGADTADTKALTSEISSSLVCPSDRTPRSVAAMNALGKADSVMSSYAYNVTLPVVFRNMSRVPFPVNTVTFFDGDVAAVEGEWKRAPGWQSAAIRPRHGNSANFLYLDGHVERLEAFPDDVFNGGTVVAELPEDEGDGLPIINSAGRRATTTTLARSSSTTTVPAPTTTTRPRATTTTLRVTTTTVARTTTTTTRPPVTTTTLPYVPETTLPPTTTTSPITTTTLVSTTTTISTTTTTMTTTSTTTSSTTTSTSTTTTSTTTTSTTTTSSTTTTTLQVPFIIDDGDVVPQEECSATILCVGSAIQNGAGGPRIPVEALYRLNNGTKTIITTDVLGGELVTLNNVAAGTEISVGGKCMKYISNQFWSDDGSGHTWVLRDGDTVPSIAGYSEQRSIKSYLAPYIDENGSVTLTVNQTILLFELSSDIDYTRYSWADFQDLVVLITFEKKAASTTTTTSTTTTSTTASTSTTTTSTTLPRPPGTHLVAGLININPNNRTDYEFTMILPDGTTVTRDNLHADTVFYPHEGFAEDWLEYTGPAILVRVKPKGNGNQNGLTVDGEPYSLRNADQYTFTSTQMNVHLYNDKRNKSGKAMGKWWISIDANNVTIDVE